jgi:hypothetical protein
VSAIDVSKPSESGAPEERDAAARLKTVEVLVVVDVEGALTSGSSDCSGSVYLVDTNQYMGSGHEGQVELMTACKPGQTIQWNVSPISADNDVEISGFTGAMIQDSYCVPKQDGSQWVGLVQSPAGYTGNQQYSVTLTFNNVPSSAKTFDPYLVISAP